MQTKNLEPKLNKNLEPKLKNLEPMLNKKPRAKAEQKT